jgi:hypothetical protein
LVRCARPQFHFRSLPEPGGAQVLPTNSLKVKRLNQRINSLQKIFTPAWPVFATQPVLLSKRLKAVDPNRM